MVAYSVGRRKQEIGIRLALGATADSVVRLTVKQGMRPVGAGMGFGILAALGCSPLLASQLYGVTALSPITLFAVAALLFLVAALACYVPARRAARVDPMVALRSE